MSNPPDICKANARNYSEVGPERAHSPLIFSGSSRYGACGESGQLVTSSKHSSYSPAAADLTDLNPSKALNHIVALFALLLFLW